MDNGADVRLFGITKPLEPAVIESQMKRSAKELRLPTKRRITQKKRNKKEEARHIARRMYSPWGRKVLEWRP